MTKSQKTPPLTDAELEKWLFCNLGGDSHASGLITLCLSSSNPARPLKRAKSFDTVLNFF
ncbi:hypothetical protein FXJ99_22180 [Escherichia coli]|nr:hypothetical protein [Escherichia coli]